MCCCCGARSSSTAFPARAGSPSARRSHPMAMFGNASAALPQWREGEGARDRRRSADGPVPQALHGVQSRSVREPTRAPCRCRASAAPDRAEGRSPHQGDRHRFPDRRRSRLAFDRSFRRSRWRGRRRPSTVHSNSRWRRDCRAITTWQSVPKSALGQSGLQRRSGEEPFVDCKRCLDVIRLLSRPPGGGWRQHDGNVARRKFGGLLQPVDEHVVRPGANQ